MTQSWSFEDDRDREALREPVTKQNCGAKLELIRKLAKISRRELAGVLGVSEGTLRRIETSDSEPTDEFMTRLEALSVIGVARFGKVSKAEQEQISELVGASGGVVAGVGGALGAIGAAGSVAGFSAAGITSGLAAIGGGAMLTGVGVVAAIPIATGLAGYGLVKALKAIVTANGLSSQEVDGRWEIRAGALPTEPKQPEPKGD